MVPSVPATESRKAKQQDVCHGRNGVFGHCLALFFAEDFSNEFQFCNFETPGNGKLARATAHRRGLTAGRFESGRPDWAASPGPCASAEAIRRKRKF
jgi:hypothetical protein